MLDKYFIKNEWTILKISFMLHGHVSKKRELFIQVIVLCNSDQESQFSSNI